MVSSFDDQYLDALIVKKVPARFFWPGRFLGATNSLEHV